MATVEHEPPPANLLRFTASAAGASAAFAVILVLLSVPALGANSSRLTHWVDYFVLALFAALPSLLVAPPLGLLCRSLHSTEARSTVAGALLGIALPLPSFIVFQLLVGLC